MTIFEKAQLQFNHVPFSVISKKETAPQMGLIILETDLTIETEFRSFLSQNELSTNTISLLNTRIPCDDKVTSENLKMMEERFSESLALFPKNYAFDVIGYGCTSASLLIGDEKITKLVKSKVITKNVTTPMSAIKRGLKALGAKKIGYLAPYISEIAHKMCANLSSAGFEVKSAATFSEDRDSIVGIITPSSILKAIESLINKEPHLDAIFVSCTSLKCARIIPIAEEKFNLPIISSNSALAWDMAKLSNALVSKEKKGKLFTL